MFSFSIVYVLCCTNGQFVNKLKEVGANSNFRVILCRLVVHFNNFARGMCLCSLGIGCDIGFTSQLPLNENFSEDKILADFVIWRVLDVVSFLLISR